MRSMTNVMRCVVQLALMVGFVLATPMPAEESDVVIGFRHDNTGVFPGDCDPVTSWREYDFVPLPKDEQTRHEKFKTGKEVMQNIIWRKELPLWTNGGCIVAGGKLLVMCDRTGYGYATEIVPDFIGAQLLCIDPADGSVLWAHDCHHVDDLPKATQQQFKDDLRLFYQMQTAGYDAFLRWRGVGTRLLKTKGEPDAADLQVYQEAAQAFSEVWAGVPKDFAELKAVLARKKGPIHEKVLTHNYAQAQWKSFIKNNLPEHQERWHRLKAAGYNFAPWFGKWDYMGSVISNPVSDGQQVWVSTAWNDAYCVDMAGNRIWSRYFGGPHGRTFTFSPMIYGDLLIVCAAPCEETRGATGDRARVVALDKHTGKTHWESEAIIEPSVTTPSKVSVPLADESGSVDCLYVPHEGLVIRLSDGKTLAQGIGLMKSHRPVAVHRNIIFIDNGSRAGTQRRPVAGYHDGVCAIELTASDPDTVTGKQLWTAPKTAGLTLVDGDVVYVQTARPAKLFAFDAVTGKERSSCDLETSAFHYLSKAGGKLFLHSGKNGIGVVQAGDDLAYLGTNVLGVYRGYLWTHYGAQSFFSGNRAFFQSNTHLYCIGDASQPMRLSEVHR